MLFSQFDRISIINLPHRTDRRREVSRELDKVALTGDKRVRFFEARTCSDKGHFYSAGAKGCFVSHMKILEDALRQRERVLILEDDCDFTQHVKTYRLPADWDIFYGGFAAKSLDFINSDIVGAHCMGFSLSALERLVPWLQTAFNSDDPAPIDGEYVRFRRANRDLISVFAVPQVAVQRPSRTDIGNLAVFDRLVGIRNLVAQARKVKRALQRLNR